MYTISIDEDAESTMKAEGTYFSEHDLNIGKRQIIPFPTDLGLTGFCFKTDAINFSNNFKL